MSSIIIASVPIHGHVTPLLAVARHLVARGDRVRFITGARFADAVTATGATPRAVARRRRLRRPRGPPRALPRSGRPQRDEGARLRHRARLRPAGTAPTRRRHGGACRPSPPTPCSPIRPSPVAPSSSATRGAQRPPVVVCGVLPLSLASRDTAPYGLGLPPAKMAQPHPQPGAHDAHPPRSSGASPASPTSMYRDLHGVALPYPILDWAGHADAIVQFTVPAFEYPRSDAPATLHFAGPLSATGSQAPRPGWWADLDSGRPVIHVTQGTIANKDFGQLVGPTLEALADDDVLVVVSTGGRPLDTLPPLPDNARAAEYLPYDELLPRTDVFVTNGGYGGVQYALRYGVPIVATGGKEDKPEVGGRVAWSGVGRRIRTEQPSPRALRRAITPSAPRTALPRRQPPHRRRHGRRPGPRRAHRRRRRPPPGGDGGRRPATNPRLLTGVGAGVRLTVTGSQRRGTWRVPGA